jgi:hypothetical protein
LINIAENRN